MPTLCSLLPRSQRDVHPVQRQGDAWVYDLARILRSETEEPSDGLSQIAAHVLATSVPMLRKLLFTKLSHESRLRALASCDPRYRPVNCRNHGISLFLFVIDQQLEIHVRTVSLSLSTFVSELA